MHTLPDPPETVAMEDLLDPEYSSDGLPVPAFTPWRPLRVRVGGWSAEAQHVFIHELTRIGSVAAAARVVGKTARSAYLLRDKDGAESFAAAWEMAMLSGQNHAQQVAIDRALHGQSIPHFRGGRITGYRTVFNDRLLVSALNATQNHLSASETQQLTALRYRLEKWESALRREAMDMADGTARTQEAQDEAWQDHVVWQREMKTEARRQRNAEIRVAVRKSMAKAAPPPPGVRML